MQAPVGLLAAFPHGQRLLGDPLGEVKVQAPVDLLAAPTCRLAAFSRVQNGGSFTLVGAACWLAAGAHPSEYPCIFVNKLLTNSSN